MWLYVALVKRGEKERGWVVGCWEQREKALGFVVLPLKFRVLQEKTR